MTAPAQFVPQPRGADVCPCERCPPAECEGIALVNRLRAKAREQAAQLRAEDPEGLFA